MTPQERKRLIKQIRQATEPLGCAFLALGDTQLSMTFPDIETAAKVILWRLALVQKIGDDRPVRLTEVGIDERPSHL